MLHLLPGALALGVYIAAVPIARQGWASAPTVYTVYMTATVHYSTLREGRDHLKDLLDAAVDGRPASVTRDHIRVAAVDAERLACFLSKVRPANADVTAENGGWTITLPGLPIAADADTLDEALDEAVDALRDYAEAWSARLRLAPNHAENWGLVQIIEFSSDDRLKAWLRGE